MKTVDITELLFLPEKLTPEEQRIENRKLELWGVAQDEAKEELSGSFPFCPLAYLDATRRIYKGHLAKEGLKYDEERGL